MHKIKTIITVSFLMALCGIVSINAQTTVKGDGNAGELNSLELDALSNQLMHSNAKMKVVARLGDGETANSLNQARLETARTYLIKMRGIDKAKVTFTEGESLKGEGRLEFYLDDELMLISLAERGKNVRIGCCADEEEVPPKTETNKTEKPLEAKALAALISELKEVVSRNTPDKNESKMVADKWAKRKDLAGKTKSEVIELLFWDVKSVIKDSGTQYQIYSIFTFYKQIPDKSPTDESQRPKDAEANSDKPIGAKSLAALMTELKDVVSKNSPNENEAKLVSEKWDKRTDLAGKTKSQVIELLFLDVKSVIKDSGTQYQIYSIFTFYKQIPNESPADETQQPKDPEANTEKPMEAKALSGLIVELKEVVSKNSPDKNEAKLVNEKWDKRTDLAGKTKSQIIELLFEDVKSVIKDSGVQYQIYSIFSFYKNIPDKSTKVQPN